MCVRMGVYIVVCVRGRERADELLQGCSLFMYACVYCSVSECMGVYIVVCVLVCVWVCVL